MSSIPKSAFQFLKDLEQNNTRDWMQEHKSRYKENEKQLKIVYTEVTSELNKIDVIEKVKVFRINRDIRFSNNKMPYNVHRSASWSRAGAERRGGYYLRLEPGNSYMAGGFFSPEKEDLLRIRKEFEIDASEIRAILKSPLFSKSFNGFNQEDKVKTAPRGFDKEHENIDLIQLKRFFVTHPFSDEEVFANDFQEKLLAHFQALHPFFDYMSAILTTDLNGESLL